MLRCLQLAAAGAGSVAPNPMVGAVLVHDDKIIGEGYHKKYGEAHAEVNCINSVRNQDVELISKATLYVSLEPCDHYGKTPPCTDLIIKNKIPKVAVGCRDIYKDVDGRGIIKLQHAGINVLTGVLEKECTELYKRFFTFHKKQRPYIILKWAQSLNGKMGSDGKKINISNDYTKRIVHKWRSEEASIMIGTKTALNDDPLLTARHWKGNNPVRIIIDKYLKLPSHLKIFNEEARTIIFNNIKIEEDKNLIFYKIDFVNNLQEILNALYEMNIQSVLVEGGATLLESFIGACLWDEARVITNTEMILIRGVNAPALDQCSLQKKEIYLGDNIDYFRPLFQP